MELRKMRAWLTGGAAIAATVMLLDTGLWWVAVRQLERAAQQWAERQRLQGAFVELGPMQQGGWPWAATLAFDELQAGSSTAHVTGGPAAGRMRVAVQLRLSWLHPRSLLVNIRQVVLTAPGLSDLSLRAVRCFVALPIPELDRAEMHASDLLLRTGESGLFAVDVSGRIEPTSAGPHVTVAMAGLRTQGGGEGPRMASADLLIQGGWPPLAQTAEQMAYAWQAAGGAVELRHADLSWGPLDATLQGRFGLDAALAPFGSGTVHARGLGEFLDMLATVHAVPARSGQAARGILSLLGQDADGRVGLPVSVVADRVSVAGVPVLRLPPMLWHS